MHLNVGDVIWWNEFPYPKDGGIKARWFIYLGRSSVFHAPIFTYLCTTTTQIEKFESGGPRTGHASKRFDIKNFPVFDRECVLDFDEELYEINENIIDRHRFNIEIKGSLDENTMRNIYKQLLRSGICSKVILRDIHESYNRDGITGLKRP